MVEWLGQRRSLARPNPVSLWCFSWPWPILSRPGTLIWLLCLFAGGLLSGMISVVLTAWRELTRDVLVGLTWRCTGQDKLATGHIVWIVSVQYSHCHCQRGAICVAIVVADSGLLSPDTVLAFSLVQSQERSEKQNELKLVKRLASYPGDRLIIPVHYDSLLSERWLMICPNTFCLQCRSTWREQRNELVYT